jgi:hypothetical protein
MKRLTYEFVQTFFKEQECKLLESEYNNNYTKMRYICVCKNESTIAFNHFQNGKRCMKCSGKEKLTYEYVYNFFKERNCILLSNEYKNSSTKMKYECICKNISEISFDNFRSGYRCMKCSGNERLTLEYVQNYFKENNCILLEAKYINSNTKMQYKCQCNNESSITWDNFKQGYRCIMCGYDKQELSKKLFKQFTFPSGEIRYENIALTEILESYNEPDIVTSRKNMPKILYELNGKQHRYYPDIWIKSINKIIKVKSCYTYRKELIKNINKALFTRKLKYEFEFWIYTPEKKNIYNKIIL